MTRPLDLAQPVADQQQFLSITLFSGRGTVPRVLYVRAVSMLEAEALLARLAPGATNVLIERPANVPPARIDVRNGVLFLSPLEEQATDSRLPAPITPRLGATRPSTRTGSPVPAYRADPGHFGMQMDVFGRMRETEREFAQRAKEVLP